ncbi:hypothetical protein GQ44DRAFT_806446 [Phaeosphaeriaceae sp. PMI808]|nr:hypothetical protein GQ44DRAFT_806446 [Phaeosphaeriaceae sp. PMI808]
MQQPGPLHSTTTTTLVAPKRSTTTVLGALSRIPGVTPIKRLWNSSWTAEWLSCIFSILSLLGLVATLIAHQNKPLPQWPQLVSLNSIVSLFALLIRSGTTVVLSEGSKLKDMESIDSASRGAFGSFLLLVNFSPRSRPYYIAAFGAFLTMMSAWTGFTSQQVISFSQCAIPNYAADAGVLKTNYYDDKDGYIGSTLRGAPIDSMVAGIELGMIQPPSPRELTGILSVGCPSGNCTFPSTDGASFQTIGVGHTCKNVTSYVRNIHAQRRNGTMDPFHYWANVTYPLDANFSSPTQNSGYASEIGIEFGNGVTMLATGAHITEGMFGTVQLMWRHVWNQYNLTALHCELYPTINTYGVAITNNIIQEKLIESVPIGINGAYKKSNISILIRSRRATSRTLRNGRWETCKRQTAESPDLIPVVEENIDATPEDFDGKTPSDGRWYYERDCVYSVHAWSMTGSSQYLREMFDNKALTRQGGIMGSIYLRRLYREGNITIDSVDEAMKNMAASMTAVVRSHGNVNQSFPAKGTVWQTTTCLQITWEWLAFPATMIGLSVIFLVLVQIENRGIKSERLWKSSILATLFCEVDNTVTDNHLGKPMEKQDMSKIAKSTSMSLESNNQTLRLVQR